MIWVAIDWRDTNTLSIIPTKSSRHSNVHRPVPTFLPPDFVPRSTKRAKPPKPMSERRQLHASCAAALQTRAPTTPRRSAQQASEQPDSPARPIHILNGSQSVRTVRLHVSPAPRPEACLGSLCFLEPKTGFLSFLSLGVDRPCSRNRARGEDVTEFGFLTFLHLGVDRPHCVGHDVCQFSLLAIFDLSMDLSHCSDHNVTEPLISTLLDLSMDCAHSGGHTFGDGYGETCRVA